MVPGAPEQAGWNRTEPRRAIPLPLLERMIHTAIPHARILEIQPLLDGLRNANFKLQLDSTPASLVLRIYEHDASLCLKEIDLLHLVSGSVPVPEMIHAEPFGLENLPPFALMTFIEGVTFRDLQRSGTAEAIAQAAFSAGETLAAIGRKTFPKAGWIAPGPAVTAPLLERGDSIPRFVDLCLESANLQRHLPSDLRDRTHDVLWSHATPLSKAGEKTQLVHGDFNRRNLLVRSVAGQWTVAAVLDWEFAVSGSPLGDLGNFLRYESSSHCKAEPHFSAGYLHAGGTLAPEWRRLAKLVDLTAVCESLTHDWLPDTAAAQLAAIVRDTVLPLS